MVGLTDIQGVGLYLFYVFCLEKIISVNLNKSIILSFEIVNFVLLMILPICKNLFEFHFFIKIKTLQTVKKVYILLTLSISYNFNCNLCYRTLEERAQRLFSTKGKKSLDPNLLAKSKPGKNRDAERQREIAFLEGQVYRYISHCLNLLYEFFYLFYESFIV